MREIKFRAWVGDRMITPAVWINDSNLPGYSLGCAPSAPLMQYTGWKDVDGVEIYEGDFLKGDPDGNIWLVGELLGGFVASDPDDVWDYVLLGDYDFYVIGNIHQNPELLEASQC